ncbi:MAG: hypothetical protein KatS3mg010_1520 [Acidimicrobiia bacterium]|nr:MAG: hypothetical protein KatS3mg010_1520 [Acidimicrobiia bacterium]
MTVPHDPASCGPEPRDDREAWACWVTCWRCGDVLVAGERCDLVVCADGRYAIAFTCPRCACRDEQGLDARRVEALLAAGFVARPRPSAPDAPGSSGAPTPLGAPELLAFRALLAAHDHLAELASDHHDPGRAANG